MDKVSLALSALLSLALVIMIAPGILARNHGKILRNTALWVAIFLGLALAYKHIGPGRFDPPTAESSIAAPSGDASEESDAPPPAQDPSQQQDGYTPPSEE